MELETTEQMEAFAPPPVESSNPEDFWPTDQFGNKEPMDDWTISDLGKFPDWATDWLKRKLLEAGKKASVELLNRLAPSQIAQDPKAANQEMGQIVKQMGITPIRE